MQNLILTLEEILDENPCKDQGKLLINFFGERTSVEVSPENLRLADECGLDLTWFIVEILSQYLPDEEIRLWCCKYPGYAYWYALKVDEKSRADTRSAACENPLNAYRYARCVDITPRDDTREAACGEPEYAYRYARYVDRAPRDDTREAACREPKYAYQYTQYIDKTSRDDTRKAACKDVYWKNQYIEQFGEEEIMKKIRWNFKESENNRFDMDRIVEEGIQRGAECGEVKINNQKILYASDKLVDEMYRHGLGTHLYIEKPGYDRETKCVAPLGRVIVTNTRYRSRIFNCDEDSKKFEETRNNLLRNLEIIKSRKTETETVEVTAFLI